MLNQFEGDHNLSINLVKEKELLDKAELNKEEIKFLINKNKELYKEINMIINKYLIGINIFLKLFSILFIIASVVGVGILCNYNLIVMLLFSVLSPVACIFMNVYITELFKKRYRYINKKILCLETLINENNIKINELKQSLIKLNDCITEVSNYNHKEKNRVYLSKNNSRREDRYYYSQDDHKVYSINKNIGLKRIRKINNKTRK